MSRAKGTPKTGGRKIGTPNKVTNDLRTWVASILDNGRERFISDLDSLEPIERVRTFTNLLNYVLPKQQAIDAEAQAAAEYKALLDFIDTAPDEIIDKIANKIMEMKQHEK